MASTSKGLSALQILVRFGIGERTSKMCMQKIREAMKSIGNLPRTGLSMLINLRLEVLNRVSKAGVMTVKRKKQYVQ
jgi:hypothetical protein